jgi:predicted nucleotidyltransferase
MGSAINAVGFALNHQSHRGIRELEEPGASILSPRQTTAAICLEVQKNAFRKFGNSPKRLGLSLKARMLNKDYREMLQCLLEEEVRFLLVGAYAVGVHGFPRATKDIDFFVWATPENATNLVRALVRFGAPLDDVSESDFSTAGIVFQIGHSPRRIAILTNIGGVEFEHAYANRKNIFLEGLEVPVISITDLIANKRASGRTQDLADVEKLESASNRE